ncbi:uncharacterized protein LOC108632532 [Ceratina calcarata]|uniref:Uncharacterized protein LOC108632532 n=1 Tax=Ceratina calcarata TaxID=156304 RepID=A0AAJ7NG37_9HYME|nr:uncharacterized protein LOC108632532 [Ceratina calcarata]
MERVKKEHLREQLKQLAECDEIVSSETVQAIGQVTDVVRGADDNAPSSDELDEDLEEQYKDLNFYLELPNDTYSLTEIRPELPTCVRYGVRAGLTHINMPQFSPLSKGHQGGASAIAAFAATTVYKSHCWNEAVIDQIIEDGDTFYCESYKDIHTDDRRLLSILDLKRTLCVQNRLTVNVSIQEAAYAGKFRSTEPTELHLVKALDLFFKRHRAGILCSSVLNIAIWRDSKYYNLFDGQARQENCEPAPDKMSGTSKLFLVKDLIGLLFIILEKSNVKNEPFCLYAIEISGVDHYTQSVDAEKAEKPHKIPQRRPSGYKMQAKYRAVVQGSYHITHPAIPAPLRGRTYMIIALAALVYSRLVNANKWTSALIDLIFNQSNIYFVDLVRVLDKDLKDEEFELRLDDVMGDIILGAYSAKIKIRTNVVPGYGQKKGKLSIDDGIREFFDTQQCGLLEIKNFYYAIWRHDDTYYFMDPYACDDEGFRSGMAELDGYEKAGEAACVTMNSSINQVMETIMENTGSRDRDPFVIHGIRVLYVKTGTTPGGPLEKVIYREKGTNRRPQAPTVPAVTEKDLKQQQEMVDMTPKIRADMDKMRDVEVQVPDMLRGAQNFMMTEDEPVTYVIVPPAEPIEEPEAGGEGEEEEEEEEEEEVAEEEEYVKPEEEKEPVEEPVVRIVRGYKVVNPNRLLIRGSKNCLDEAFDEHSRGKQGLIAALSAIAYRKLKDPTKWRNMDIDQLIDVSNTIYEDVVDWIRKGRPAILEPKEEMLGEAEEEEEEEEELEGEGEEEEKLLPRPSHLDLTMLPVRLKMGENDVFYKTKMKLIQGEAMPLANLAEALECYFKRYSELVLENKRLMYGIWKSGTIYCMFNPYGSDEEGWRIRDNPASFAVVGNLNELTDLLYGVMEFNDPSFIIHFVALDSIQPGLFATEEEIELPDETAIEQFKTRFLPITDDDLDRLEAELLAAEKEEEEVDAADIVDIGEEEEEEEEEEEKRKPGVVDEEEEKPIIDPLLEVEEQDQPDAPYRLNLILLTSNMKIFDENEETIDQVHEQIALEKLKYDHPPPYVMPSGKTLAKLLEAKRAKRSIPSLVSRFSIDSRLDVKKKGGLSTILMARSTIMMPGGIVDEDSKPSKMIKLSPKRYLYSRILPICLMPMRAINDIYIQDDDITKAMQDEEEQILEQERIRAKDFIRDDVPEVPIGIRIRPMLIPLGPIIRTPIPEKKVITCMEKKKRKCLLSRADEGDAFMEKILCNTEDLLLELLFPDYKAKDQTHHELRESESKTKSIKASEVGSETTTTIRKTSAPHKKKPVQDVYGLKLVKEEGIRVLFGNICLENRAEKEICHFKSCFFTALLCILTKIKLDPDQFSASILDQLIFLGDKIYQQTGKLRYKPYRWFHHIEIVDTLYNVITRQTVYADPENCDDDELEFVLDNFFEKHKTGIIVFLNCSYALWTANDRFYLFDPYACDDKGNATEGGYSCFMEFCDQNAMIEKIENNVGENVKKPYRIYTVCIAHMETRKRKKKRKKKRKTRGCVEKPEEEVRVEDHAPEVESSTESEASLIEQADWVKLESKTSLVYDMSIPGFAPIENCNASMFDVIVLENEITRPILAPFKKSSLRESEQVDDEYQAVRLLVRRPIYDRKFKPHSAVTTPLDLCIMAWSLIHDPITWSVRTVRGLFDAALDYAFDSVLATEDSTVSEMTDGLLHEFEIANYTFRVVFVPLHYGTLYTIQGWNLSMSLQKVFETPSYTGAIIVCGDIHIGVLKKDENHFAWWTVRRTKNLRIITSIDLKEFLKLLVREIDQPDETVFMMRVITVSYAQKVDPDCSDTKGLHEPVVPATSLAEIHRMTTKPYDLEAIFRNTVPESHKPIYILGTVGLTNRDTITEPKVKRCYFVAVLAVMVKRDIIQSPMPGMIDKVLEVAEAVYREFAEPKFHLEHILRNVTVMNRIFDFRDCASPLVTLTVNPRTMRNDFYLQVRKHVKKFFKTNTSGILHFSNCCYGFWYSRATNAYYYLDPYQCNEKGRKVASGGKACLCIFPSVCQMVRHMCLNQFEDTSGFFIHQLHVDSVNVPAFTTFKEDPMWLYLDYHWNFRHAPDIVKTGTKKKKDEEKDENVKQFWNNYAVEVSNLIYSVWGTIGSYDSRFGDRAGKNQAAICVAVLAMQYLSHPSRWGPAILDSAVICGDSYYTESLRSSIQKCSKHYNKFNLQLCFKIFPHLWTIDFKEPICGVLYGARNRMTFATGLLKAFEESPNVIIECNKITLAALAAKDGYYIADPCWVGPPLFNKDHGAIYVLRCRNMNTLVYAVIKMLNTNQRLDYRLTPVSFTFEQEDFVLGEGKSHEVKKKVLLEPLRTTPGRADESGVFMPGAQAAPEGGSYLMYRKNLALGILKGHELENPELPSFEPKLDETNKTSVLISTTWHLNLGQAAPLEKTEPVFDPQLVEHVPKECEQRVVDSFEPTQSVQMSITDLLAACDDYPRVMDFTSTRPPPTMPLECTTAPSFLTNDARKLFRAHAADMAKDVYKSYKHRLPKSDKMSRVGISSESAVDVGDIHTITEEETEPKENSLVTGEDETEGDTYTETEVEATDETGAEDD